MKENRQNEAAQAVKESIEGKGLRVFVRTFGCQQNEADSERLLGIALSLGYLKAERPEEADLILVNTCAIREHAEQKALSTVGQYKRLKEEKPDLILGVCGCMPAQQQRANEIKSHYPYVSFTMAPGQPEKLPELILFALQKKKRRFLFDEGTPGICEGLPIDRAEKHRAWVTVMYGCNNFCSYCIVPYVRGRERSRDSADIIAEVKSLISSGTKEITLLGQNVNSYHSDCDFAELLDRLASLEGEFLIRFMTSHPKDVPSSLISVMAKHPTHIEPHFHLPLQSGSDRILKAMNRHYDTARYRSVVAELRKKLPGISLTSDVIVGFPGETEEDFSQTLAFLSEIRFDMVYSFLYSPRKGTPAAELPEQVPEEVKSERMNRLLELQSAISLECAKTLEGKKVAVQIDGEAKTGEGMLSGRTAQNKLVHVKGDSSLIGKIVNIKIDRAEAFALYGKII